MGKVNQTEEEYRKALRREVEPDKLTPKECRAYREVCERDWGERMRSWKRKKRRG